MNWTPQRLDQLGYLSRGRSRHRPRDAAPLYDGPYPFIQTGDVKHAGLYIKEYQQTYTYAGRSDGDRGWLRASSRMIFGSH